MLTDAGIGNRYGNCECADGRQGRLSIRAGVMRFVDQNVGNETARADEYRRCPSIRKMPGVFRQADA